MMVYPYDRVQFDSWDLPFVQKFGVETATEMVLDYVSQNPLPFLYDPHQLAAFLGMGYRKLFTYTKHADREYRERTVPKRDGSLRRLYAPSPTLRALQRTILHRILQRQPVSAYATAYVRRRSLPANAAPHVGKRHLLKLDTTDFFGSISFEQVYTAAFNTRYFPRQIGVMLTALCCRKGVLPQGAPTSPALSNRVMERFDNYIGDWCRMRGIAYTRYCDDMTFSADFPLRFLYPKIRGMLEDMGFALNEKKTCFVSDTDRQTVTGLIVNEKVAVPREYKRRLRQEVYYALKFGAAASAAYAGHTELAADPGHYRLRLLGQVRYVRQIEPGNDWFRQAEKQLIQAVYSDAL